MKEIKPRRHKISDANPIAALLVNVVIGFLLWLVIGSIFEFITVRILGLPANSGYPSVLVALILLLLYRFWYRPEFEGALKGGRLDIGLKLWIPILISWLTVPFEFIFSPAQFGWPTVLTVGISLAAGFAEETLFRSFALSTIMRKCKSEKMILIGLILSALLFAVVHGLNRFGGANSGSTVFQIIAAGFLGLFLGALYLRCGNLWPSILVHALNDIIAMTDVTKIDESGVITGGVTVWSYVDVISCIIVGIIGLWMVRPAKRAEIMEIWSNKWKQ